MNRLQKQQGLSFVELMVALVIGLVLTTGMVSMFVQSKRSFSENERIARMQDDARFALDELARDIAGAAFWGEITEPANVSPDFSLTISTDCAPTGGPAWAYDLAAAVTVLDNATAAAAAAQFGCIEADVFEPVTDVIGVKRAAGRVTGVPAVNGVYLKTNGVVGLLFKHPEAAPPAIVVPAPSSHYAYVPAVYYVRRFTTPGDGVPTLCRKFLDVSAAPTFAEECIAQGVENLQLEYGIDGDADGQIDQYVTAPTAAQLARLHSVRIMLLMRSIQPDNGYVNDKTYQLSNAPLFTPDDNIYRRTYSTTVVVQNVRNQSAFGF